MCVLRLNIGPHTCSISSITDLHSQKPPIIFSFSNMMLFQPKKYRTL